MSESTGHPNRRFLIATLISGLLTNFCYATAMVDLAPSPIRLICFLAFGPLLVVAATGIRTYFSINSHSHVLDLACLFLVIGASLFTLMAAMQSAVYSRIDFYNNLPDASEIWQPARVMADAVQLGADVAWDFFFFSGMILLGLATYGRPTVGRPLSVAGVAIGLFGLLFNLGTFPIPPNQSGLIDVGPLSGLWFLILTIVMWRGLKHLPRS